MIEPSPFGRLLRSLRVGQNLTLEALASRSGVSVRTIGACLDLVDAYIAVGRYDDAVRVGESGISLARSLNDDTRVLLMMRRHIRALIRAGEGDAAIAEADEALRMLGPGSSEAFIFERVRKEVSLIGSTGAAVAADRSTPTAG